MIFLTIWCLLLMFVLGYMFCDLRNESRAQENKPKKLEEVSDRELFALQMAVFDEISRRGAAMIEPFEEFKEEKKDE